MSIVDTLLESRRNVSMVELSCSWSVLEQSQSPWRRYSKRMNSMNMMVVYIRRPGFVCLKNRSKRSARNRFVLTIIEFGEDRRDFDERMPALQKKFRLDYDINSRGFHVGVPKSPIIQTLL